MRVVAKRQMHTERYEVFFVHRNGSGTEWLSAMSLRMWPALRTCLMFSLGAILFCSTAIGVPKAAGKAAEQAKDAAAADFVGSDTCAGCHEEVAKGFASNPHMKMTQTHGKSGVTCENCHGAGKAHVNGG